MKKRSVIAAALIVVGVIGLIGTAAYWASAGDLRIQPGSLTRADEHACAISVDEVLVCWGDNVSNQLNAQDRFISTHGPVQVEFDDAPTSVAAGDFRTCATFASGHLSCWGLLGFYDGTFPGVDVMDPAAYAARGPSQAAGIEDAIAVAAAHDQVCALTRQQRVKCFSHHRPVTEVQGLDDAQSIAVSRHHGCAVRSDQTAACWGMQPGLDLVAVDLGDQTEVASVVALSNGTCTITTADSMWCSHVESRSSAGSIGDVVSVGGIYGECIVSVNGSVACGSAAERTPVTGITDAVRLASGSQGSSAYCAEKADARVACWGSGSDTGTLGDAGNTTASSSAVIVTKRGYPDELRWKWRLLSAWFIASGLFVLARGRRSRPNQAESDAESAVVGTLGPESESVK